jgi:disulfide bond formation protein DsbB
LPLFSRFARLLLRVLTTLALMRRIDERKAAKAILYVSFLGVLFSGYFTFGELPILFEEGFAAYMLGLPTCALGLIFYVSTALISGRVYLKTNSDIPTAA